MILLIVLMFICFVLATYYGVTALKLRSEDSSDNGKKCFKNSVTGFLFSFVAMLAFMLMFTSYI